MANDSSLFAMSLTAVCFKMWRIPALQRCSSIVHLILCVSRGYDYPQTDSVFIDRALAVCHDLESLGCGTVSGEFPIGLRVSILASGSSGNLTLLETERTRILVDAGLGKRETLARLAAVECEIGHLDAVLITHEHADHCNGLPQMLGLWKAPLYVTEPTMGALQRVLPETFGKRLRGVESIQTGQRFAIGDIDVHAFAIPHDAVDPIGFTFRANGIKVAICTDLGYMPELVKVHLRETDCLILESNHDPEMLKVGPYPWVVKQRVLSRTGHLSNHAVSEFLADPDGFDARARFLVLAHISQENNNPDLVRICAEEAFGRRPSEAAFMGELLIASQQTPLKPLQL
jgi:phosphoribosyl 1,2-cyclic phosphodiesterase